MAGAEFSDEQLRSAPSLKGKFDSKKQPLTDLERAVAAHQGLLEDDGTLKDAAVRPVPPTIPSNMPQTLSLEELMPEGADGIKSQIMEVRGANAKSAVVEEDKQVDTGLQPPELNDEVVASTSVNEPGANQTGAATVDIKKIIKDYNEPVRCSYCGWDQRAAFRPPDVTDEDKLAFIRHIMSTSGRFFKEYKIFGGNISIVLRSRSQAELEAILMCARQELKDGELAGVGDLQAQLQRYHISAAVAEIINHKDSKGSIQFDTLASLLGVKTAKEAVHSKDKDVFGEGRSTGLYTIISSLWLEFERLYGYLIYQAHTKDFWEAAVEKPI